MPNIAFLSTAHIHTKSFLENIAQGTDGRRVHAIWDEVPDRGRRYAAAAGTQFVSDLAAVLADPAVDAFAICAENTRHLPLLEQVLPVGKPVFCEKPLVTSVADLQAVRKLVEKYPAKLLSGYFHPFGGAMQAVARLLADNSLGKITHARFRNAHHAAYGRWFDSPDLRWFTDPVLAGGGAFMDMGTHAVHLMRTLFGPVTEVWATIRNQTGIYPAVDDFGLAHLKFASGVLGTVEASWTQTGGIGGLEVVGAGAAVWNTGSQYVIGQPGQESKPLVPRPERPTRMDRLVAAVRGEITAAELQSDLTATIDSVAIMEAAYASSRTGNWVKVAAS
jgi:predicted dehydrogenase